MTRITMLPCCVLLALAACASQSEPVEVEPTDFEADFIGGWDGAQTEGTSVLLLREGLTGTLSAARLRGEEYEFDVSYEVEGTMSEEGGALTLMLNCAEIRTRPMQAEPPEPTIDEGGTDGTSDGWSSLDCAGWELDLECGLAGDCGVGDCNMVCDVVYFGDAYATAAVPLTVVEDEFDYWQRV